MKLPQVVEIAGQQVAGSSAWDMFTRLAHLPGVIFFDSARVEPERGRYSYITAAPFETITVRDGKARVTRPATAAIDCPSTIVVTESDADPFAIVGARLAPWVAPAVPGMAPFQGGAAGLFGFGLSRAVERIARPRWDEFQLPDLVLGLHDWVIAHDHVAGTCHLISQGFPAVDPAARQAHAERRVAEVLALLDQPAADLPGRTFPRRIEPAALAVADLAPCHALAGPAGLLSNFAERDYVTTVERAIELIRAGDIFQVNLSQRLLFPLRHHPLEIYRRLRERNPAPHAGYMDLGDAQILSSSPEQFLSLTGRDIVTRPIKGTRPRGYTPESDSYGSEALRESAKDRAENIMIVDLLRNDLSRVSKPRSVVVPRLFEIERHPTVHHLVSEVRGELRDGLGAMDLLRATFPGGSVTGAPKVRALEIIAVLEPTARGAYCGSLGWVAFHGDLGLNLLIRTLTASRGWLQFPVGGGIVALSNAAIEYQETLHKAAGMLRAVVE